MTALNFQLFGMITAFKMMELKRNLSLAAYLSARKTYLQKTKIYLQARRVHDKILSFIAFIPLKSLLLRSGSRLVSSFSARAEIPFRLHGIFSDFSARLPGLKILARFEQTGLGFSARAELRPGLNHSPCNRQFDFKRICFRSRAEVSARLTGLKFAM